MTLAPSFQTDVPLAGLTTLGVGGPARLYAEVRDVASLKALLETAKDLPVYFLGEGSNMLVADAGFDGLVARTVAEGRAGLECLSGIPGLVGAAPMQNIGAYGQEVAEVLTAVRAVDRQTGEEVRFPKEECGFAYRTSHFKTDWRDRYVITAIELELEKGGAPLVKYADLRKRLPQGATPSLQEVRALVLEIRASKSMVYNPADPNHRSAGSFFLNPIVPKALADAIQVADMPVYPAPAGQVKLSAAWLMERAGFPKGYVKGRAGLSTNHVLAVINRGGATAAEILELAAEVRARVHERFGVELHQEPNLLGF